MKNVLQKVKKSRLLFVVFSMFALVFGLGFSSQKASADELQMKPGERGNVYYDTNNIYTMSGTKHGAPWSDATAAMAISPDSGSGQKVVFCIEPGVPFNNMNNPDYEAVAIQDLPQDAQIVSVIWNTFYAFGDNWSNADRITAQAVIWEMLPQYGIKVNSISGIPDFAARKQKLLDGVKEYKRLPEFDSTTVKLKYGESKTLTSSVNLLSFETLVGNTAKVNWNVAPDGKSVEVTPTDPSVTGGRVGYMRSFMQGTPIALQKPGSQTVYLPSIKDPNAYQVLFDIETTGDLEILKLDHDTGKALPNFTFKVTAPDRKDIPAQTVKTGTDGKAKIKGLPHGTRFVAKEIDAPAPYVLGAAFEESDEVEGIVEAGKTITLTKRNKQAKGQITVDKSGKESNKDMWNGNYSLDKTTYEVRKDKVDGPIAATFETDASGFGKTNPNLDFGTYYLVESKAGIGFAKTFEPQKIVISYENQLVAVVVKDAKGTNQEVTGSNLLTKEDSETKEETQGKATFEGAEYSLFNKDGSPVKWDEKYKPELLAGTEVDNKDKNIVLVIDDNRQVGVKHLALGEYYWQETKAPEGYQIDNTKHSFSITYKDQSTEVIETKSTSKEKVVKFNLDFFKYLQSEGAEALSGYNGIEFTLTPIDPTKGEVRTTTTETDNNGYDGYGEFHDVPYGDYVMHEVKAPEGYKAIKDLYIKSSFDQEKREYTFTITEDGQKEPIKTLTVPESKINEGSNIISLSKLFLTNKKPVVNTPKIRTKATSDGEKTFYPSKETPMHDKVTITGTEKDMEYTNKIKLWRVQDEDYENAKVVWEGEKDFVAEGDNEEQVIDTMVDTSNDDAGTSYVFTEELFVKDGPKVAEHEDLTDKEQTVKPKLPLINTLATVDGEKTFFPSAKTPMHDRVNIENVKKGETYTSKIKLWRLINDDTQTAKVVWEGEQDFEATGDKMEDLVDAVIDTTKDDATVSYVFTEELYVKGGEKPIGKHEDLTEKTQTIRPIMPGTPTILTEFVTKDGKKEFDPTKDHELVDKVTATVPKEDLGKTFYYVTQFHKIDAEGKDTVVGEDTSEHKADQEEYTFDAIFQYKANMLKDGEKLVATHVAYKDKDHKEEYAKHFDLSNEKQTLTAKKPEIKSTPVTPTSTAAKGFLPQTAAMLTNPLIWISALALVAGAIFMLKTRNKEGQEK